MGLRPTVRFSIICHRKDAQRILDFLANERVFHPAVELTETEGRFIEEPSHLKQLIAKIEFCLGKIKPFLPKETFIDALQDKRPELKLEDAFRIARELDVEKIYEEISRLSEEADKTRESLQHIDREIEQISDLRKLDLTKEALLNSSRKYFSVYLFRAMQKDYEAFLAELDELEYVYRFEEKNEKSKHVILLIIVCKEKEEDLLRKASQAGFTLIEPPEKMTEKENFKDYLDRLHFQRIRLAENLKKIQEKISAYASIYSNLLVAFEFYLCEMEKFEKSSAFKKTKSSVLIDGWVPREQSKRLKNLLETNFLCEVFIDSVADGRRKPVILENKGILKSMQFLTELYGNPRENEPDPTPVVAPYFLIFFGFCVGDAGYGLLLALIGIFLKLKFRLKDTVRSFADIFIYGGLGAVIIGILSASYFSIETKYLPAFLASLKIFEPIESPVSIIVLSLVLGFMHVLTGIILSAYVNYRENFKSLIFVSEIGKILLLIGAFLSAGLFLSGYENNILQGIGKYSLISGAALIVLFSSDARSFVKRILSGFYSLYGMTSYLGDISSYARLMALMLAGVLIGMAVNMLSKLAVDLLGVYAGLPIAVIIAIFGHVFNLVMSVVSAFVHSLRLQFVEFFKQFYSDGGIKFNPIGIKEKYIKIRHQ